MLACLFGGLAAGLVLHIVSVGVQACTRSRTYCSQTAFKQASALVTAHLALHSNQPISFSAQIHLLSM
jgi:hypothetical protein